MCSCIFIINKFKITDSHKKTLMDNQERLRATA